MTPTTLVASVAEARTLEAVNLGIATTIAKDIQENPEAATVTLVAAQAYLSGLLITMSIEKPGLTEAYMEEIQKFDFEQSAMQAWIAEITQIVGLYEDRGIREIFRLLGQAYLAWVKKGNNAIGGLAALLGLFQAISEQARAHGQSI